MGDHGLNHAVMKGGHGPTNHLMHYSKCTLGSYRQKVKTTSSQSHVHVCVCDHCHANNFETRLIVAQKRVHWWWAQTKGSIFLYMIISYIDHVSVSMQEME